MALPAELKQRERGPSDGDVRQPGSLDPCTQCALIDLTREVRERGVGVEPRPLVR